MNSIFLLVVDAYSKWVEVVPMSVTLTSKTIEVLREIFARYGLHEYWSPIMGPNLHRKNLTNGYSLMASNTYEVPLTTHKVKVFCLNI